MSNEKLHRQAGQAIRNAWRQKDTSLLALYLASSLEWHESVSEKPLTTAKAVLARWDADLSSQIDITTTIELLDFVENRGYHHCNASWQDNRGRHRIDALFIIHIDSQGKIIYFMPWYEDIP